MIPLSFTNFVFIKSLIFSPLFLADGQISRMSILPDTDDEGSTGSSRSFSRMSQQDQGYDINSRLRLVL